MNLTGFELVTSAALHAGVLTTRLARDQFFSMYIWFWNVGYRFLYYIIHFPLHNYEMFMVMASNAFDSVQ